MRKSAIFAAVAAMTFAGVATTQAATITQWNFNTLDANNTTGTLTPSIGAGSVALVGGTTATFASGNANGGSTDPELSSDDTAYNLTTFAPQGTQNKAHGVEFTVSTLGFENITVSFDQRHSNTSSNTYVLQYSTDGSTFVDAQTFVAPLAGGDTWYNVRSADLSALTSVDNNANFKVRIVSAFGDGSNYIATTAGTAVAYAPTGTGRFDMVTVSGTLVPEPAALGLLSIAGLLGLRRRR